MLSAGTLSIATSYAVTRTIFGREHVREFGKGLGPVQGSNADEIAIKLPSLGIQQIHQLEAAQSVVLTLKGGSELPIEVDGNEATIRGNAKWSDDEEYEERYDGGGVSARAGGRESSFSDKAALVTTA